MGGIKPATPHCTLSHTGNCVCVRVCVSVNTGKAHTQKHKKPFQMEQAQGKPREERHTSSEQQTHPYHQGKVVEAVTVKGGLVVTSHNPAHDIKSPRDKTALKGRAQTRTF